MLTLKLFMKRLVCLLKGHRWIQLDRESSSRLCWRCDLFERADERRAAERLKCTAAYVAGFVSASALAALIIVMAELMKWL